MYIIIDLCVTDIKLNKNKGINAVFKFTLHRPVNNSVSNIQSFVFLFEVQRVAVIK